MIEVEHLTHARGQVRCNLCGTVFDGLETLSASKPHEDEDLLLHDFDNAPPLLTQAYHTLHVADEVEEELEDPFEDELNEGFEDDISYHQDLDDAYQGSEDVAAELDDIITEAIDASEAEEGAPGFVAEVDEPAPFKTEKKPKPDANPSATWVWSLSALAMVVLLGWQAQAAIGKGQLQLPEHPVSEQLCEYIDCVKATEQVDLNAISLVSRNIRPHPGRDQALIISASMINANENNQKFPALEIKLSDLDGQIVAMRRFVADEYVPADVLRAGFLPNTLIPINLEIVSPGDDAVAFEIGFVQP